MGSYELLPRTQLRRTGREVQEEFLYLEARGDPAWRTHGGAIDKEQKEYTRWLQRRQLRPRQ